MGSRGRPATPAALKKAQGTYRKHRDAPREAQAVPVGSPPRPTDLSPEALAIWEDVVPKLIAVKTLSDADGGVLESYCRALAQARKLDAAVAAGDLVIVTAFGAKLHPAIPALTKLWPVVERLAFVLGLHYVARARTKMPEQEKEEDPTESFLFGGGLKAIDGGAK